MYWIFPQATLISLLYICILLLLEDVIILTLPSTLLPFIFSTDMLRCCHPVNHTLDYNNTFLILLPDRIIQGKDRMHTHKANKPTPKKNKKLKMFLSVNTFLR